MEVRLILLFLHLLTGMQNLLFIPSLVKLPLESLIAFSAMAIAIGTIGFLWKFRKSTEVIYLMLVEISAAIWAMSSGIEYISGSLEMKKTWAELSYLGIAFLPVSYYLFTKAFRQKHKNITPRNILLLSLVPVITILLVFTNDHHHLIWKSINLSSSNFSNLVMVHGAWYWFFWIHCISIVLAGLYNLIKSFFEFSSYYKPQVIILLIATLIPLIGNIMYITGLNPIPGFDWTPVLFIFTGIGVSYGIVYFRMFNLVPFARNTLIDSMNDGIIIVDAEGFIEDYNPAIKKIFKIKEPLKHKQFSFVFSKFDEIVAAVEKGKNTLVEIDILKTGRPKAYQVKAKPIYNRNKKFRGYLIQLNNVTSLKHTENILKQVNKKLEAEVEERGQLIEDLDSFAHTVAHDLKNSLGSIYNVAEIIEECIKTGNTEMLKEFSGDIKSSARQAIHITHELLLLATVNHHEVDRKPLEMGNIFNKACEQIEDLIIETNARINCPQDWPQAQGYGPWVEEIWVNYLTNAIKYGGNPPEITVGAVPGKKYTRFWIRDNGNGILRADQEKLFKKYSRLNPEKAEGYGLGLSIVKRIAQKLGGHVGLNSTGIKGEGSCFWFELPSVYKIDPIEKQKEYSN